MFRIIEVKKQADGSRIVVLAIAEPRFDGVHTFYVEPGADLLDSARAEIKRLSDSFQQATDEPEYEGKTFEVRRGKVEETSPPDESELDRMPWMRKKDEQPLPPPPPGVIYELYEDEISHPKLAGPLTIGTVPLVTTAELTPDEIDDLQRRTKRKIRKVA